MSHFPLSRLAFCHRLSGIKNWIAEWRIFCIYVCRLRCVPSIASNKNIFQSSRGTREQAIKNKSTMARNLCKMMWAASPISHLNFLRHHRITQFEFVQRKASLKREIITRSNWQFSYLCIKYEFEMMRRHGKEILPSFHHFMVGVLH